MKEGFFNKLLSASDDVSSKRFAGLCLVGFFIAGGIVAIATGTVSEVVESILNKGLITGSALLGINLITDIVKNAKRTVAPVVVEDKKDDDKD